MEQHNVIPEDKVRDVLITKTAIKTLRPVSEVEKIVTFQFKNAIQATKLHNEVEISGFGKFKVSLNKLKKKLKILHYSYCKLEKKLQTETIEGKRKSLESRKERLSQDIDKVLSKYLSYED